MLEFQKQTKQTHGIGSQNSGFFLGMVSDQRMLEERS